MRWHRDSMCNFLITSLWRNIGQRIERQGECGDQSLHLAPVRTKFRVWSGMETVASVRGRFCLLYYNVYVASTYSNSAGWNVIAAILYCRQTPFTIPGNVWCRGRRAPLSLSLSAYGSQVITWMGPDSSVSITAHFKSNYVLSEQFREFWWLA